MSAIFEMFKRWAKSPLWILLTLAVTYLLFGRKRPELDVAEDLYRGVALDQQVREALTEADIARVRLEQLNSEMDIAAHHAGLGVEQLAAVPLEEAEAVWNEQVTEFNRRQGDPK